MWKLLMSVVVLVGLVDVSTAAHVHGAGVPVLYEAWPSKQYVFDRKLRPHSNSGKARLLFGQDAGPWRAKPSTQKVWSPSNFRF